MEKDTKKIKKDLNIIIRIKNLIFSGRKRIIIIALTVIILGLFRFQIIGAKNQQPQYQTAVAEKGTLVSSLSESGQVAVANRISITTQASGMISIVDVKNGDTVTLGQQIAVISQDQAGQQRQAQAWASYLSAKSSLDNANAQLYSLQSTMFSKWKTYTDIAQNSTYQNSDGSPNTTNRTLTPFMIAQDDWLAAEASYKNQQNSISQAQASLNSSWLSYQFASPTITAPMAGTIADLIITPGTQIGGSSSSTAASTGTSTNSSSSQTIATIKTEGKPVISVSLSEVDAAKVKGGQKATITFDALPNQTFTGKVIGINTAGSVSSGVTTYPATIQLDLTNDSILPNMSATANIIVSVKDNVLLVPSGAVMTINGQPIVRVLKNGQITSVNVEIGNSSDTQTEITSGLNVGDTVVAGSLSSQTGTSTTSPFSGGLRLGGTSFGGTNRGGR